MNFIRSIMLALTVMMLPAVALSQTKIIDHGPDGQKIVIAVLGDGYTAAQQQLYHNDVDRLIVNGVFANDFFRDNANAFNVYRIDLISNDFGVSKPGRPKDTALQLVYNGQWENQWVDEESDETKRRINTAVAGIEKPDVKFNYVVRRAKGVGILWVKVPSGK